MMTSSNGNIFRVTGPLCGEFTGPGEFPTQRPVTRSFDVFSDLRLNERLSKQPWGWGFETPSWSLWRQCNASSMLRCVIIRRTTSTSEEWLVSFFLLCRAVIISLSFGQYWQGSLLCHRVTHIVSYANNCFRNTTLCYIFLYAVYICMLILCPCCINVDLEWIMGIGQRSQTANNIHIAEGLL